MKKKTVTIEDVFEAVSNGFTSMEHRMVAMEAGIRKDMATKDDLKAFMKRTEEQFDETRSKMATKDDIRELETKLIEDTGAITGSEQKHFRSLTQRVTRLEKVVFQPAPTR